MQLSANGLDFIKAREGLMLEAYFDVAGIPTIGYGHTSSATSADVVNKKKISHTKAEELLVDDVEVFEDAVNSYINVPMNQNQFDAFVSFAYNIGVGGFLSSTARKRFNRGDTEGAAEAMTWWDKATVNGVTRQVKGLVRRRALERDLFLKPMASKSAADNTGRIQPMENRPSIKRTLCDAIFR